MGNEIQLSLLVEKRWKLYGSFYLVWQIRRRQKLNPVRSFIPKVLNTYKTYVYICTVGYEGLGDGGL